MGGLDWWTEERTQCLRVMWAARAYASKIASELGCTRNAVIGKAHRLGLESRPRTSPGRPRSSGTYPPRIPKVKAEKPAKTSRKRPVHEVIHILDNAIPLEQRRTVMTVQWNECHFPIGHPGEPDFFYCGGPVPDDDGRRYCEGHRQRMFLPKRHRYSQSYGGHQLRIDRFACR